MQFTLSSFDALSNEQLYAIMRFRQEVFVVEQDCPYVDADNRDQDALHLMGYHKDVLMAYARILPKGISYKDHASIGRVISHPNHRGSGFGKSIMQESIRICQQHYPNIPIKISAQTYAKGFYESLGFETIGEEYLEDDIPHVGMVLRLQ